MSIDKNQLQRVFLQETADLLESLESTLLDLEEKPKHDELADQFMRTAHTLKGSAATAGFDDVADLSHRMEDMVELLKSGRTSATAEYFDQMYKSLETLRRGLEEIAFGRSHSQELLAAELELGQWLEEMGAAEQDASQNHKAEGDNFSLGEYDRIRLKVLRKREIAPLVVKVDFAQEDVDKPGTALKVIAALKSNGDLVATVPPESELDQVNQSGNLLALFGGKLDAGQLRQLIEKEGATGCDATPYVESQNQLEKEESQSLVQPLLAEKTVRIEMEALDDLLRLVGELMINRSRFDQIAREFEAVLDDAVFSSDITGSAEILGHLTAELQSGIMQARMVPVARVFRAMKRQARKTARLLKGRVRIIASGEQTELDKKLADFLDQPLTALVEELIRATADRAGLDDVQVFRIGAERKGNQVSLIVEGSGSIPQSERISRILAAFSEYGGRLETIKANDSYRLLLWLPITLAIIPVMMVEVGEEVFAFPLEVVQETLRIKASEVSTVEGKRVTELRGEALSLLYLDESLEVERSTAGEGEYLSAVVIDYGSKPIGVVVDRLLGKKEIVIKPLSKRFGGVEQVIGSTILGDGRVALIVNARALADSSAVRAA